MIVFLLLQVALLAVSIPDHPMHIDEAWIGEQTWFLARDGHAHSSLFEGFAHNDQRIILYHRLFVMAGSAAVHLFGWSLGSLRIVPILSSLLLLASIWLYLRRWRGFEVVPALIALALMLLIPINFYHFKIYRPEVMMTLFGFASCVVLERFEREKRWYLAIASALLAGLAALTHLYGIVFIIAGAIMLLVMRRRMWSAAFMLAAGAVFIPYLLDVAGHYDIFREQISNPIAAAKTSFTWLTPLTNLASEHTRLFRRADIIPITILFILALVIEWRRNPGARFLHLYTILLVILLGALVSDKVVTRYAIPLFPFFSIVIASAIRGGIDPPRWRRIIRPAFILFLAILLLYGIGYQVRDAFGEREKIASVNASILPHIPEGEASLAPMGLIFGGIDRMRIVSLYLARKEHGDRLTLADAIRFADEHRLRYIVLTSYTTHEETITDIDTALVSAPVDVVRKTEEYLVLRRRGEE